MIRVRHGGRTRLPSLAEETRQVDAGLSANCGQPLRRHVGALPRRGRTVGGTGSAGRLARGLGRARIAGRATKKATEEGTVALFRLLGLVSSTAPSIAG